MCEVGTLVSAVKRWTNNNANIYGFLVGCRVVRTQANGQGIYTYIASTTVDTLSTTNVHVGVLLRAFIGGYICYSLYLERSIYISYLISSWFRFYI